MPICYFINAISYGVPNPGEKILMSVTVPLNFITKPANTHNSLNTIVDLTPS